MKHVVVVVVVDKGASGIHVVAALAGPVGPVLGTTEHTKKCF